MKLSNPINKNNWLAMFEEGELVASFNGDTNQLEITFFDHLIFAIDALVLHIHIEDNYEDLYEEISYIDEDDCKSIDYRSFEDMDWTTQGNAEVALTLYFEQIEHLYSNKN